MMKINGGRKHAQPLGKYYCEGAAVGVKGEDKEKVAMGSMNISVKAFSPSIVKM